MRFVDHTRVDTTQLATFRGTSDQLMQRQQQTTNAWDKHPCPQMIRTWNPNNQAAPDLRSRHLDQWDLLFIYQCFFCRHSPQWARASSFTRFLDHTQRRTTVDRTPLDEWSTRRRDLYTTHNTHNRQTSMPRWDSNPQYQQANGRRPTHWTVLPLGPALYTYVIFTKVYFSLYPVPYITSSS